MTTKKVQKEEIRLTVTKQYGKMGPETVTEEQIEIAGFVVEPARIQTDFGLTLSLGKYESARLGISVSLPCYREELDAAYEFAKQWATDRLEQEVTKIRTNR